LKQIKALDTFFSYFSQGWGILGNIAWKLTATLIFNLETVWFYSRR
jgi:hypothetical protein